MTVESDANELTAGEQDGKVVRFSTVIRDQREVIDLQKRLSQAERLEAIGRLAGGVAHDFNNLLTVIDNCAVMAQEELPEGSAGHQDVAMILQASERATALCRQLLGFARRQFIQPEPTLLNAVVIGISGLLRRMIGEHIQLELELDEEESYIRVDPSQIDQVLANLAVNARDAMPSGGVLIISTTTFTLDEPQTTNEGSIPAGEYVELSVSDTGEGMTLEVKNRIFEPFYSNRGSRGSGLGLATVYGAISQNQGHITVETAVGKGTQFRILLPRIARERESSSRTRSPAGDGINPAGRRRRHGPPRRLSHLDSRGLRCDRGELVRCRSRVGQREEGPIRPHCHGRRHAGHERTDSGRPPSETLGTAARSVRIGLHPRRL